MVTIFITNSYETKLNGFGTRTSPLYMCAYFPKHVITRLNVKQVPFKSPLSFFLSLFLSLSLSLFLSLSLSLSHTLSFSLSAFCPWRFALGVLPSASRVLKVYQSAFSVPISVRCTDQHTLVHPCQNDPRRRHVPIDVSCYRKLLGDLKMY